MSFPGRNSNQSASSGDGLFANLRRSVVEGAVGEQRNTIIAVLLGMILGMATAYMLFPVEYTGAAPRHMSPRAVDQWVRMIAVGHSDGLQYDDANARIALQQVPDPQEVIARLERDASISQSERGAIAALKAIDGYANLTGAPAPADPGLVVSGLQLLLALAVVAICVPLLMGIWRRLAPQDDVAETPSDSHASRSADAQAEAPPRTTPRSEPALDPAMHWGQEETEESGGLHPQHGLPVLQGLSTYIKGSNYDESFAIELGPEGGNQFLGECGLSMATRVGNELQAVEFWGFDMASQESRAKIFAAPAALSDPALIAAVGNRVADPSLDIVPVAVGAILSLETRSMLMQAEVRDVVCNYAGGAPNSGIESLRIELIAWQKRGVSDSAPTPSGENPFTDYADPNYGAPASMPAPAPPPPAAGQFDPPASKPAPAKRPEDEEEDPFGGTGNFMPYS